MEYDGTMALIYLVFLTLMVALCAVPTIIAFYRGHEYRWVIFALCMFGGWTGILWIIALVWAVFPANRSLADPFVGNPTGLGHRNSGDALGNSDFGRQRGFTEESGRVGVQSHASAIVRASNSIETIKGLKELLDQGAISEEEFAKAKRDLLK